MRISDALYSEGVEGLLGEVRLEPETTKLLMVVGHEPTCSQVVSLLIGGGLVRMPTAAIGPRGPCRQRVGRGRPGHGRALLAGRAAPGAPLGSRRAGGHRSAGPGTSGPPARQAERPSQWKPEAAKRYRSYKAMQLVTTMRENTSVRYGRRSAGLRTALAAGRGVSGGTEGVRVAHGLLLRN